MRAKSSITLTPPLCRIERASQLRMSVAPCFALAPCLQRVRPAVSSPPSARCLQTQRSDVSSAHVEGCRQKLIRLDEQRADLAKCLDQLLGECARGEGRFKVYRQFKMYNDPQYRRDAGSKG